MEINNILSWTAQKPLIIAGPCSAETEEQLLNTCQAIVSKTGTNILRAGIWKPRTRPNQFEGVGEVGLQWFSMVKKELKTPIATEVANAQQVELALKYGVDVLWIGARSTVNPFTVQEIADALKGVNIPVIIKNPVNPDLALWQGAIERINKAGITQIAALHRGFSTFEKTDYRNPPMWQIALELKTAMPELPLFCDPSHITGKREMILKVAQKAMDLNYDGLMIETHIEPDKAWSDASQQVTPIRLGEILKELVIREKTSDDPDFRDHLVELRQRIDTIDREIVEHLAARMEVVRKLGDYKKDKNVAMFQVDRLLEILQTRSDWAEKMNLNKNFVGLLYKQIHEESIRIQTGR